MPTDLTQTQEDLLQRMRAGEVLKETRDGGDMLIVGRYTSKVLRSTVNALVKAGRIRDAHRLDDRRNKLFELAQPAVTAKPGSWPFPKSGHAWS